MFTTDSTNGYTAEQLDAFNAELAEKLAAVPAGPHHDDQCADIEKAFADEVAAR